MLHFQLARNTLLDEMAHTESDLGHLGSGNGRLDGVISMHREDWIRGEAKAHESANEPMNKSVIWHGGRCCNVRRRLDSLMVHW